jgi:large subunit ribosomal protein L9
MKVILQKDIPNLGDAGEIKEVADGYARNYLIPRKLVLPATAATAKAAQHQKRLIQLKTEKRRKEMSALSEKLKSIAEIEMQIRVGSKNRVFGSITPAMIAKAIEEKSGGTIVIDRRKIEPGDPIKALGEHKLRINLSSDLRVPIVVKVVPHPDSEPQSKDGAATEAKAENAAEAEVEHTAE